MFAMTGSLENGIENGCCNKTNKTADFRNGIADFLTPFLFPLLQGERMWENGKVNGCCNKTNKTADFRNGIADFLTPFLFPPKRVPRKTRDSSIRDSKTLLQGKDAKDSGEVNKYWNKARMTKIKDEMSIGLTKKKECIYCCLKKIDVLNKPETSSAIGTVVTIIDNTRSQLWQL